MIFTLSVGDGATCPGCGLAVVADRGLHAAHGPRRPSKHPRRNALHRSVERRTLEFERARTERNHDRDHHAAASRRLLSEWIHAFGADEAGAQAARDDELARRAVTTA